MKILASLLLTLVIAGCSSSSKKDESASTETKATTTAPTTTTSKAAKATSDKAAATPGKVTCTHKEETRTIEVRTKDKGCETAYTKAGAESVVATSNSGTAHCTKVQGRIQENLKGAGYSCQ